MTTVIETVKIRAHWIPEVSMHGGMSYVSIPKRVVDYYDIRPGDKLHVHVDELKRERAVITE